MTSDLLSSPPMVLVIEDKVDVALEIEEVLDVWGASEILTVTSLHAALDVLNVEAITCAILSYAFDRGTSLEVARILRSKGIPFIFTVGFGMKPNIPSIFTDVQILQKQCVRSQLVSILCHALEDMPFFANEDSVC